MCSIGLKKRKKKKKKTEDKLVIYIHLYYFRKTYALNSFWFNELHIYIYWESSYLYK